MGSYTERLKNEHLTEHDIGELDLKVLAARITAFAQHEEVEQGLEALQPEILELADLIVRLRLEAERQGLAGILEKMADPTKGKKSLS